MRGLVRRHLLSVVPPTPAVPDHSLTSFQSLGLADELLRGIADTGYETPTPIQRDAIPIAIEGRDLTGCAQTGTGKTAAFVLPMLHRLLPVQHGGRRHVRALVVAPTRELALQVEESVRTYGKHTGLRSTAVFGGVGAGPQLSAFRRGIDIVIATPGRLLDHVSQDPSATVYQYIAHAIKPA